MRLSHRLTQIALIATIAASPAAAATLDDDLDVMLSWFAGEFDNHQQVIEEQEAETPPEQPHEWIHSIFVPVDLPALGEHVFYVEQYTDGDPAKIYRNRLYTFSINQEEQAVQLTIHSFADPKAVEGAHLDPTKLAGLTSDDVRSISGCEVYWKRVAPDRFIGSIPDGACRVVSQRSGKTLIIDDDLVLTPDEIWIGDRAVDEDGNWVFGNRAGIPHKLKRSHNFTCWAVVKNAGSDDWAAPARGLILHDQGGRAAITSGGAQPTTYRLELEQRTYTGERQIDVLKLAVYEEGKEESLAYTWSEPGSTTIGMNLRWFQAGCSK